MVRTTGTKASSISTRAAATRRRLLSLGLALSPWQKARYEKFPAVGRFEGERFDPRTWKPHWATTAYIELRADDAFWAARRVMAFDDEMIRAIVRAGEISDPAAEKYLADILIQRRDKIGRAYLTAVNPIVDPALDGAGTLTFGNVAVQFGTAAAPESVHGRLARVRQRNRRGATVRRNRESGDAHAGTAGASPHPGNIHKGGSARRQRRAAGVGTAHPGLLQEARERLETRWT